MFKYISYSAFVIEHIYTFVRLMDWCRSFLFIYLKISDTMWDDFF